MRTNFSKAIAGSMIAGAALLVAACGTGDTAANNTMANDLGTDPMYDTNMTDLGNMGDLNATDTGNLGDPIENAQDHLDNAQQELQNAQ